eukprot:m.202512 g.202512  ORF g.202512 m.202512 type:complete len:854 (-) comp16874_c1_seq6:69-2630(-)
MKKRAFLTLMGKGRDARGRADQDQDGILPPGHSVVSSPRSPVFYHDVCFSYQIQASSLLSISTMEKAIASVVSGAVAVFGLACIFTVLTRPSVNECDMTYMYPNYLPVEGPAHPRYNLFIYKERQQHYQLKGRPVLFIPGHLGSFQQVRSLGSHLDRISLFLKSRHPAITQGFDVFTIDFQEEPSGLSGHLLGEQAAYVYSCLHTIPSFYAKANLTMYPIIIIGHSMGGLLALSMLQHGRSSDAKLISTIITLAAPISQPIVSFYPGLDDFYSKLSLRKIDTEIAVIMVSGGFKDRIVLPTYTVPLEFKGQDVSNDVVLVDSTRVPGVMISTDHVCILWCNQLVRVLTTAIVNAEQKVAGLSDGDTARQLRLETYRFHLSPDIASSAVLNTSKKYGLLKLVRDQYRTAKPDPNTGEAHLAVLLQQRSKSHQLERQEQHITFLLEASSRPSLLNISRCVVLNNHVARASVDSAPVITLHAVRNSDGTQQHLALVSTQSSQHTTSTCISTNTPLRLIQLESETTVHALGVSFDGLRAFSLCYHIQVNLTCTPGSSCVASALAQQRQPGFGTWLTSPEQQPGKISGLVCDEFPEVSAPLKLILRHHASIKHTLEVSVDIPASVVQTLQHAASLLPAFATMTGVFSILLLFRAGEPSWLRLSVATGLAAVGVAALSLWMTSEHLRRTYTAAMVLRGFAVGCYFAACFWMLFLLLSWIMIHGVRSVMKLAASQFRAFGHERDSLRESTSSFGLHWDICLAVGLCLSPGIGAFAAFLLLYLRTLVAIPSDVALAHLRFFSWLCLMPLALEDAVLQGTLLRHLQLPELRFALNHPLHALLLFAWLLLTIIPSTPQKPKKE